MAASLVRVSNLVVRRSTLAGGSFHRSVLGSFLHTNHEERGSSCDDHGLTILSRPFYEKDVFDRFETSRKIIQRLEKMIPSVFRVDNDMRLTRSRWKKTPKSDIYFTNMTGAKEDSIKISIDHDENSLYIDFEIDEKLGPKRDAEFITDILSTPQDICNYKINGIKAEVVRNSGILKITFPKFEENEKKCFHYINVNLID